MDSINNNTPRVNMASFENSAQNNFIVQETVLITQRPITPADIPFLVAAYHHCSTLTPSQTLTVQTAIQNATSNISPMLQSPRDNASDLPLQFCPDGVYDNSARPATLFDLIKYPKATFAVGTAAGPVSSANWAPNPPKPWNPDNPTGYAPYIFAPGLTGTTQQLDWDGDLYITACGSGETWLPFISF